jgi:C1A family cysteine protease
MTESDYPYKGRKTNCAYNKNKATNAIVVSQGAPTSNNMQSMMKAVTVQPVSVGVDASGFRFQAYKSGVFSQNCGTDLDHATLVVGYGTDKSSGMDYWIMKNSWGTSWGMDGGYMRLVKKGNGAGQCGIQNDATFATTGSA